MIKLKDWIADVENAGELLEEDLKKDPNLKAQLDAEVYRCKLLNEIEKEKIKEKEREKKKKQG